MTEMGTEIALLLLPAWCPRVRMRYRGYAQTASSLEAALTFQEELKAVAAGKGKRSLLRWGKRKNCEAWPEQSAPQDDAISQQIAERIDAEFAALRLAVFRARQPTDARARRPAVAADFSEHLQKLKMLMLVGKVELRLESVNQQTGEGVYNLVDQQLSSLPVAGEVQRSAAVLQIERPTEETSNAWKMSFIPGGRVRMDTYALMLQRLIAWRFFTPQDRYEGEGIPARWLPTGAEVQQVALESSMKALSFKFLANGVQ